MIGESDVAKATVRGLGRPRHERPLGTELAFVEGVLEYLAGWPAPEAPVPEGVLSFVRYEFSEAHVGALGRELRLAGGGPEPKGMHLCADPATTVHVFERGLPDLQAHVDALVRRELGARTMVLFTPATRRARIVCANLPFPGIELDLARDKTPWTMADLDRSISDFNIDVVEASDLMDLVTDGVGLRPGGRRRYNEALYLHLRFGLGLDRRVNCGVHIARTGLALRPRGTGEERLTMFGKRAANAPPRDETATLQRRVTRWAARGERPVLHMRCLCCDAADPCSVNPVPERLTIGHPHLQP
ncbi:MAG: hypothetical protein MIN69_19920 [Methylorubrum extorquens]|jgi:hypothetical protein|uniref:hypothetical protein n=1 Tax=Methylorubrum extorquens TaxID=408 RepID=UPI002FEDF266